MITRHVKHFKASKKYLCKDFYISANVYGIYGNKYEWEVRREMDDVRVGNGYSTSRSSALKEARDKRKEIVALYNGKTINNTRYKFLEPPCPDDEDYECYGCGGPTGRGYDNGLCCECLGE